MGKEKTIYKFIDVHSHILPSVDDGAKDIEESMKMMRIAKAEGIERILLTPHTRTTYVPEEVFDKQLALLKEKCESEDIHIPFYRGTEVFYTGDAVEYLRTGKANTLNGTSYVLTEFMPMARPNEIRNDLMKLLSEGYKPIVAHIERYPMVADDLDNIRLIRGLGVKIQVNVGSFTGFFGGSIRKLLYRALDERLVDFLGTDAHDAKGRAPYVQKCLNNLYKDFSKSYIEEISYQNAEEYLHLV